MPTFCYLIARSLHIPTYEYDFLRVFIYPFYQQDIILNNSISTTNLV